MKKTQYHAVLVTVPSIKKIVPIYKMIDQDHIELKKLTLYGDTIFEYELGCRDEHGNRIILRKGLISSFYPYLFRFHYLDGIELDHSKFKLEITLDRYHGEGSVELEYRTIDCN